MQQSSNPVVGLVTIAALVAISVLVRRGRLQSRTSALAPRERIRPLAITLIDPVISVIIIGPFVWHFVDTSALRLGAMTLGGVGGVAIGWARARIMFVRALKDTTSVVLRRSGLEYGLVVVLIVLRSLEGTIDRSHSSLAVAGVTGLATLALVEALSRSAFIVQRYAQSPGGPLVAAAEPDPPAPPVGGSN
jgi:hypothetical protein